MVTIQIICVGKLKEKFYAAAVAEYEKRLTAFCKLSILELPEERLPDNPSPALIQAALAKEGEAILQKLPKNPLIIALCVEGKPLSSEALAEKLSSWMVAGHSNLVFLIGGSFGLSPVVKEKATLKLSLSAMTWPHHLARVMLLEQIYRGFMITQGSNYHK